MIGQLLVTFAVLYLNTLANSLGEVCVDHNKREGICKRVSECHSLSLVYELYLLQRDDLRHKLLQTDTQNCNKTESNRQMVVCCKDGEIQTKSIGLPVGKACVTPNSNTSMYSNLPGVCSDIADCPSILNEFQEKKNFQKGYAAYLNENIHESQRNCEKIDQFVCCPQDPQLEPEAIAIPSEKVVADLNPPQCGKENFPDSDRIVGGKTASVGAWPWMALYGKGTSRSPVFTCGGTIISQRHVMTAAHCLLGGTRGSFVRLGVHDVAKIDSNTVDIRVLSSISHEDFDNGDKHSDIAILLLIKEIMFTTLIAPICLPLYGLLRTQSHLGTNPYIAGWGRTSEKGLASEVLQAVRVPVVPNSQCEEGYKKVNGSFIPTERQFDEAVLCAGKIGVDSCQGDSGGPLMTQERVKRKLVYYQIGIVSYGIGCGRENLPGVYTSVQYFAEWIRFHVEGKRA